MDAAIASIKQLASTATADERRQIIATLHDAAYSLEDSNDTIHRFGYLHLQTAAVKIGFDLNLFKYLSEAGGPLTLEQIAQKTGAEKMFLSRYMSYLASVGTVKQVAKDQYAANNVTKNLTEKVSIAGISHCFETIGPQYQELPVFLKKTAYRNPSDEMHTVSQDAWGTPLHHFAWLGTQPEKLGYFNDYMAFRREADVSWLSVYPVAEETKGWSPERPVYVNIGGGIGHQCAQFKEKYPNVPGRVVLQDLPHSIEKALPTPGVENMVHNFFEPQPIKGQHNPMSVCRIDLTDSEAIGAKFYFFRGVMHNHPDHKIRQILLNTKAAMTPESVLLLDEWVLPETGVNAYAASMDLTMMVAFAAMERSESHWREILADVGLKIVKTYRYNPVSYESVMDVRLA
ncbi:S-adenosyl-L-methionine-dependent methyltransferase [Hypoxylon sp. NC0597]|nr:S-adenosyl-L-methionine-dependent methyltransferase [Hypoxylon sp. NC0597]